MKKKFIALCLCIVLLAIAIVGGTLAYLTDTESRVNTMVIGKLDIEQNEYQWNDDKTAIEAYEDGKPLVPAVGEIAWADYSKAVEVNGTTYSGVDFRRMAMANVIDKYVTVKNTAEAYDTGKEDGSRDAYVRTIIAYDATNCKNDEGEYLIYVNCNGNGGTNPDSKWTYTDEFITVNGVLYNVMVFTYSDALAPQVETEPSLCQVYLRSYADQDDKLVQEGQLEILALTQATQTLGFADAKTALNESFGEVTSENLADWFAEAGF